MLLHSQVVRELALQLPKFVLMNSRSFLISIGGEEGVAAYPADINMEIGWHSDVFPGGHICHEHDEFVPRKVYFEINIYISRNRCFKHYSVPMVITIVLLNTI